MLPMDALYQLARLRHEEQISAATRPRPEWMYTVAKPDCEGVATRHVRSSVALILRRLAEHVDPVPAASATATK